MNLFHSLGNWWDDRKTVTKSEFKKEIESLKTAQVIPQTIAKEFALMKSRIDRLELLTGLKREPEALQVPGAARIG